MPGWIVICPRCKRSMKYAEINGATPRHQHTAGSRPLIQPQGVTTNCPRCKRTATFKSSDLAYSYA